MYNEMEMKVRKMGKRLSDAELEIMMAVWEAGEPVSSTCIRNKLAGKRRWALSTLMTVLSRMEEKEYLICDRFGGKNQYRAAVTEEQYRASQGKGLLEKLYGNSLKSLVATLYEENCVSHEDMQELKEYLDSFREEK